MDLFNGQGGVCRHEMSDKSTPTSEDDLPKPARLLDSRTFDQAAQAVHQCESFTVHSDPLQEVGVRNALAHLHDAQPLAAPEFGDQ